MSAERSISTHRFRRLRYTPMRDLLRGRISGRLDLDGLLAAAHLPEQATALIRQVVRRTRLWPLEKIDVAHELLAHFADGLEAPAQLDDLISRFGDPRQTAVLIRRAKKRQRPMVWQVWRVIWWIVTVALAVYIAWAIYLFTGSPKLRVNYLAMLNARAAAVPQADRAWPVYRNALIAIRADPAAYEQFVTWVNEDSGLATLRPQGVEFLNRHATAVAELRRAAHMPGLGFVSGVYDPDDRRLFTAREAPAPEHLTMKHSLVLWVTLPHLHYMRTICLILGADAKRAAAAGDAQVVNDNLASMVDMSDQLNEHEMIITSLVAAGIRWAAMDAISTIVTEYPDLFSEDQLRDLAHLVAAHSEVHFTMEGERLTLYDIFQRIYTDDGAGGGRVTYEGMEFLSYLSAPSGQSVTAALTDRSSPLVVAQPALATLLAPGREMRRVTDELLALAERDLATPLAEQPGSNCDQRLRGIKLNNGIRYLPIAQTFPTITSLRCTAERSAAYSDATTAALAIEAFRRRTGAYPRTLDELVPAYLPQVPRDRITGGAMRYTLRNGHPILYSVGADRDDDGGHMPRITWTNKEGVERVGVDISKVAVWDDSFADGDWVLWPQHDVPGRGR